VSAVEILDAEHIAVIENYCEDSNLFLVKLFKVYETTLTCFGTIDTKHKKAITCLKGLQNYELASGSYDATVKIWNNCLQPRIILNLESKVVDMQAAERVLIVSTLEHSISLFDYIDGFILRKIDVDGYATSLTLLPNSFLSFIVNPASNNRKYIRFINLKNCENILELNGGTNDEIISIEEIKYLDFGRFCIQTEDYLEVFDFREDFQE
jgi:WD40 repeat protein